MDTPKTQIHDRSRWWRDKTNFIVPTLNRWLYNINYRSAVDCLNISSLFTYIVKVILILYTRLELKTLVLSAKENCYALKRKHIIIYIYIYIYQFLLLIRYPMYCRKYIKLSETHITGLTLLQLCACPKPWWGFQTSYVVVFWFYVQWLKVRAGCLFCWYYWNCWPSLFKLSFVLFILVELLTITV